MYKDLLDRAIPEPARSDEQAAPSSNGWAACFVSRGKTLQIHKLTPDNLNSLGEELSLERVPLRLQQKGKRKIAILVCHPAAQYHSLKFANSVWISLFAGLEMQSKVRSELSDDAIYMVRQTIE